MRAITLRNIPPEVDRAIQKRVRETGSINKAVISLLEECIGVQKKKSVRRYHDLDKLAGSWSKREADEFDRALAEQRQIDKDMWQ